MFSVAFFKSVFQYQCYRKVILFLSFPWAFVTVLFLFSPSLSVSSVYVTCVFTLFNTPVYIFSVSVLGQGVALFHVPYFLLLVHGSLHVLYFLLFYLAHTRSLCIPSSVLWLLFKPLRTCLHIYAVCSVFFVLSE